MNLKESIQFIADLANKGGATQTVTLKRGTQDDAEVVVARDAAGNLVPVVNAKAALDQWREYPERITGAMVVHVLASFISLVKRFITKHTVLFTTIADDGTASLTAVIDFHEGHLQTSTDEVKVGVPSFDDGAVEPRWNAHRVRYTFPLSDEWKLWRAKRENMSQEAFAELIEENIESIIEPAAANDTTKALLKELAIRPATRSELMNLVKGLKLRIDHTVSNRRNLDTGEVQLEYKEEIKGSDGAALTIPNGFVLCIPVFREGISYLIPARVRFRTRDGKVVWSIIPYAIDRSFRDAVSDAVEVATQATNAPNYYGVAPEPVTKP